MFDILYYLFIWPLESGMQIVLEYAWAMTHSAGLSLILLGLAVNVVLLPLYHLAETWQERERAIQHKMAAKLAEIKAVFQVQERYAMIRTLYRQNHYSPIMAVRTSFGFLIQVPFFFAAYHLLNHYPPFQGQSFLGIANIAAPDGLLVIGSLHINVLPVVMTAVNLLSASVYISRLTMRDKVQIYGVAALFLVLLYPSSAALLIYWTCSNVFYFFKNLVYVRLHILDRMQREMLENHGHLRPNFLKRYRTLTTILATSACLPLALFILLPVETFWTNRIEFVCTWHDVVAAGLPLFGLFFAFSACALLILSHVSEKAMTLFTSLLVMLAFLLILEPGPLSYRLPVLDGNLSGYEFGWRSVFDGLVWIVLLGVAVRFRHRIFGWAVPVCLCITLLCLMSIAHIQSNLNMPERILKFTPADVMKAAGFSRDDNILLLSMDMVHMRTMQKILAEHPDIRSRLTGFTNFTNNITQHSITIHSIPSMLHGQLFDGVNIWEHQNKVYTSKHSLIKQFIDKNYSIFLSMGAGLTFINQGPMNKDGASSESRLYARGIVPLHIQDMTFFRILPFGLKIHFLQMARMYSVNSDTQYISNKEQDYYPLLSEKTDNLISSPALHAYHTRGAHYPFYIDAKGQQLKETHKWNDVSAYAAQLTGVFTIVLDFLDLLKQKGLYDNSTIILASDHGYGYIPEEENNGIHGRWTPMLMVKPRGAKKPYTESDAPMSSGLIPSLISQIVQNPDPEKHLAQFIRRLPKKRVARSIGDGIYTDYYFDEHGKYTKKKIPIQEVSIDKLEKWSMGKTYSSSAHSTAEPIPALYTKGINRNGGVGFTIRNNKDGEVRLHASSGADLLDLTLGMWSTVTGKMIVTNRGDKKKYMVKLIGGAQDFQNLTGRIKGIRVPDDGILHLLFEVRGKGTNVAYVAFRDWTFTPSGENSATQ